MRVLQIAIGILLILASCISYLANISFSAAGYTQIIIPFKTEKTFTYNWIKSENTLKFEFPTTSPSELQPFDNYDERLVRRMIVKDLGQAGTEVRLVLKDRDVRALVTTFKDPFRISVDLFDKDYAQKTDPTTGLPQLDDKDRADSLALSSPAKADSGLKTPSATLESPKSVGKDAKESSSKRRLMQAMPDEYRSEGELKSAISAIAPGVGKGWQDYPPYIYRAQLAPYEGREAPAKELSPLQSRAIQNPSGMANYASKLYDFGHEGRALAAYQQVLLKEPDVFAKDPVHLWKFAECHLGQGNFQLADGYYSTLLEKHSTHGLAKFAQLRKLDITAIKSIQNERKQELKPLGEKVTSLLQNSSPEVEAQALIRKTWWTDPNASQKKGDKLPLATEEAQRKLTILIPKVESQKTGFLAASLIANRMTQLDTPWEKGYAPWLANYLQQYRGASTDTIREGISNATKIRLAQEIRQVFAANDYLGLVSMYEGLPEPMKSIRKDPTISWAVAESYRALGQNEKSIPFYQVASSVPVGIDKFKAQFWLMDIAGNTAIEHKARKGNLDKSRSLAALSVNADESLATTWKALKSDEKAQIQTGMIQAIEKNVASDLKSKTPPRILLEKWTSTLTVNPPKVSTTNGNNPTNVEGNFSPSANTVHLLDDLGKKFADLGMLPERRKALELMRFIQPSVVEKDKTAQKTWTDQLLNLAEEHRKANEFLEAGELYSLVGESAGSQENRAEANYKGGLLLYRAGKKQEAIKALEKAKADTNNLFYSKLASERLDQIQAH